MDTNTPKTGPKDKCQPQKQQLTRETYGGLPKSVIYTKETHLKTNYSWFLSWFNDPKSHLNLWKGTPCFNFFGFQEL